MSAARFDGAAVWAGLPPEAQAAIGAAALEHEAAFRYFAAVYREGSGATPAVRSGEDAIDDTRERLDDLIDDYVPAVEYVDPEDRPMLPSTLGPVCRTCGHGGVGLSSLGAWWAEEDLCSACAGGAS